DVQEVGEAVEAVVLARVLEVEDVGRVDPDLADAGALGFQLLEGRNRHLLRGSAPGRGKRQASQDAAEAGQFVGHGEHVAASGVTYDMRAVNKVALAAGWILVAASPGLLADEIYKSVAKDGSVTYSQSPQPGARNTVIDIQVLSPEERRAALALQ